jgi:hypothetical protein
MRPWSVVAFTVLVESSACMTPPGPITHVRELAQEFNLNARFGQTELLADKVAPEAREAFAAHHRQWGSGIHIADVELAGMKPRGDHDVDVFVKVAWYRVEQEELLTTVVKEGWHDGGGWQLASEERSSGDVGLLGETVVFQAPPASRGPAQFPTLRLGQSRSEADDQNGTAATQ